MASGCRVSALSPAWAGVLTVLLLSLVVGCEEETHEEGIPLGLGGGRAAASVSPLSNPRPSLPTPLISDRMRDTNPLGLSPQPLELGTERQLFTFSDRMLAGAKVGTTLVLYASTAISLDGDQVLVSGRDGPDYKVHSAYVIAVPDRPRLRVNDSVITEWAGVMRHAVVTKFPKGNVAVRFTDLRHRMPERTLTRSRIIKQVEGLHPGNYAIYSEANEHHHVLLISRSEKDGEQVWFALGYAGAAMLVPEKKLLPVPLQFDPKVGESVSAEQLGRMGPAKVVSLDGKGLFTIQFERVGRPSPSGYGLIMPPLPGLEAQATDETKKP